MNAGISLLVRGAFNYRHVLQILLGILLVFLYLLFTSDKYRINQRTSATLLVSIHPFLDFINTPDKKDKERLILVQTNMTFAYHKEMLQDPSLLKKTFERLRQLHPHIVAAKFLEVEVERISSDKALFHLVLEHPNATLFLNGIIRLHLEHYFETQIKGKEDFLYKMEEKLAALEHLISTQEMTLFKSGHSTLFQNKKTAIERLTRQLSALRSIQKKNKRAITDEKLARQIKSGTANITSVHSNELRVYEKLHSQLRSLSKKYKSEHPQIKALKKKIAQKKRVFKTKRIKLERKVATLESTIQALQTKISLRDEKMPSSLFLMRTLDANKKIYAQMNDKLQKVLSEGFYQNTDIQILNLAHIALPKAFTFHTFLKGLLSLIVVLLFVLLGACYVISFRKKQKINEKYRIRLDMKILQNFPEFNFKKMRSHNEIHLLLDRNPDHPFCNEIKRMSNELLIQVQSKNIKSVLFTHVGPESRKINIMSNLGISMAHKNKKVLLIDASWHRPILDTIFSVENDIGLLDILLGQAQPKEAIQMIEIPNLHILTAGTHLPRDFELLSTPAMKTLLDRLDASFDFIFIEASSCFEHSDILTLAQYVEGVILVHDNREKLKSTLSYKSGISREDVEGLLWLGRVNLNMSERVNWH